jgi:hypothetical protein
MNLPFLLFDPEPAAGGNQSLSHITPDRAGSHWALIFF